MYELRPPAPALRRHIEHYWFVSGAPDEPVDLRVDVFVDGRADLVFNFGAGYRRGLLGAAAPPQEIGWSNLDAQRLVPLRIEQRGAVRTSGVRFRLGGLGPFVRAPLRPLTGAVVPPEAALGAGARALEEALRATRDLDEAARLLDRFFLDRLRAPAGHARFERALARAEEAAGAVSVEALAAALGVTARQVDRLFARWLGLPPKTLCVILRFQKALGMLMRDPGCTLAEVASAVGYFDQAHFIKDFKRMSGGVPRERRGYYPEGGPRDFAPNVVVFLQDAQGAVG